MLEDSQKEVNIPSIGTLELPTVIIIIIIIYNLYRGKAPVTRSDFQGGPLRVKIKYTKAKNIEYNLQELI